MKKLLLVLMVTFVAVSVQAQSKTYTATLKKYMEASGTMGAFKIAINGMMSNFKNMNASVPDEVWKGLENEFLNTSVDDLVTQFAPVYEKHLTEGDLNEIIKFYNTPVGKKLAEKTPALTQESMAAGQVWGQAIAQKVMTKLKEKGY